MNLAFIKEEDITGVLLKGEGETIMSSTEFNFQILNTGGIITATFKNEGPLKGQRIIIPFLSVKFLELKPKGT